MQLSSAVPSSIKLHAPEIGTSLTSCAFLRRRSHAQSTTRVRDAFRLMCYTRRMLRFTKMNGAGNDFVMVDNRRGDVQLQRDQIARICDRHRGVGADGVLLLEPATNGAQFRMRYYNRDGGEAEMCGNGARCFARFVERETGAGERISFETPAGVIRAQSHGDFVRLTMSEPRDERFDLNISAGDHEWRAHFINSGVPHVVVPVP